jgi:hypothetical protein
VVALSFRLEPNDARPRSRVRFVGAGFTGRGPVYAHYVRGRKPRRTVKLTTRKGPCGTFDVKRRMIPLRRPAMGVWTLQIDHRRDYRRRPDDSIWYAYSIEVYRMPRR